MDVPNLFNKKVTSREEKLCMALVLTDTTVQAGLWKIDQQGIKTISKSEFFNYKDDKQLIKKVDEALQDLGKLSEGVDEVVFGFELGWVDKDGIVDSKKPILKKLTKELELKPVGFVVIAEALFQTLLKKDAHLSAMLLLYSKEQLTVSLIERGVFKRSEVLGRSGDAVSDLMEGLARFKGKGGTTHLPAKILIAGVLLKKKEVQKEQQALLKHQWHATHSFVHAPTLDLLPEDSVLESVIDEGGKAVVESQGLAASQIEPTPDTPPATAPSESNLGAKSSEETDLAPPTDVQPEMEPGAKQGSTLGGEKAVADELTDKTPLNSPNSAKSFGIPMPFGGGPTPNMNAPANTANSGGHDNVQTVDNMQHLADPQTTKSGNNPFSKIAGGVGGFFGKIKPGKSKSETAIATSDKKGGFVGGGPKKSKHPSWLQSHKHFALGGFIAGLLALVFIGLAFLLASKKAVVALTLKTTNLSEDVEITLDSSLDESDPSQLLLKAGLTEKEVSGTKTVDTTGVKLVGEEASGKVTIFNKTDSEKTFPAGTTFSADTLTFTLDEEVKVASASVSSNASGETKTFGNADASVTASQIGADSNLAKDTELTIDDFSTDTYSAMVAEQFSGGSSREIRVVSQEDRTKVLNQLEEQLIEEARKSLAEEAESGKYIVPTGQVDVLDNSFDAEVADEVKTLTVEATVVVEAAVYTNDDLEPLILAVMEDKIPDGFELTEDEPSILSQPGEPASGSARVKLDTNISVKARPIIDRANWKREIGGQSVSSAEAILRGKGEVDEAKVTISPAILRFISNSLPNNDDAITFEFVDPE